MSIELSYEKAERARLGTRIVVWNESGSWLGPLKEYARISSAVRPGLRPITGSSDSRDTTEKRLHFLAWETEALIEKLKPSFPSAHDLVNEIVFQQLKFRVAAESGRFESADILVDTVLARREGPRAVLSLLYVWIAELVMKAYEGRSDFSRVEMVNGTPTEVVRVIPRDDDGSVWLVDLSRQGERIPEEVWSSWCATSADASSGFSKLSPVQGLIRCLTELYRHLEKTASLSLDLLSAQLYVLDQIISLQPSETVRWAERAMINTRRGDRLSALDDLKRFFAFHDRETAPAAIVSLFDDLRGV